MLYKVIEALIFSVFYRTSQVNTDVSYTLWSDIFFDLGKPPRLLDPPQ